MERTFLASSLKAIADDDFNHVQMHIVHFFFDKVETLREKEINAN